MPTKTQTAALMTALIGANAYRNAGARVFHVARHDWISSGKAQCGADISRPALAIDNPTPMSRLCARCVARLTRAAELTAGPAEPGQTIDAGDVVIETTLHRLG